MKKTILVSALCSLLASTAAAAPSTALAASGTDGARQDGQSRDRTGKSGTKKKKTKAKRVQTPKPTQAGKKQVRGVRPAPAPTARKADPQKGQETGERAQKRADNAAQKKARKKAAEQEQTNVATHSQASDPIGQALTALESKALSGKATSSDFQSLNRQVASATASEGAGGQRAGKRMQRTVTDLEQRARTSTLAPADMAALREQWIDTRLDQALTSLTRNASSRNLTRDDFARISALLQERAAAAKTIDPDAGATRQRLQGDVNQLQERAGKGRLTEVDFRELQTNLNDARLGRALSDLERRSLAKSATNADVDLVNDRIDDQVTGPNVDPMLYEKLRTAITDLKTRALRGDVSQAEFAELRGSLTKRARNAAQK